MIELLNYDELHVKVAPEHRKRFLWGVESALRDGWTRLREEELRYQNPQREIYRCTATAARPAAMLALWQPERDEEAIYISNIFPVQENHQFTVAEYNAVLRNFHDLILTQIQVGFPFAIHWQERPRIEGKLIQ